MCAVWKIKWIHNKIVHFVWVYEVVFRMKFSLIWCTVMFWLWDTRLFQWKWAVLTSRLFLSKICWLLRLVRVRWILGQGRDELNKRAVPGWTEQRLSGAGRWRAAAAAGRGAMVPGGRDRQRQRVAGGMASRTQTVLFPVSAEDTGSSVRCQAAPRCHFKRLNDFRAAAGRAQGREAIGLLAPHSSAGPGPVPAGPAPLGRPGELLRRGLAKGAQRCSSSPFRGRSHCDRHSGEKGTVWSNVFGFSKSSVFGLGSEWA